MDIDNARLEFGEALNALDPIERGRAVRQLMFDLMDYTEQSAEGAAWASLGVIVDKMTAEGTRPAETLPPLSTVWIVWEDTAGDDVPDIEGIFTSESVARAFASGIGLDRTIEAVGIDDKKPGPDGMRAFEVRCEIDKIVDVRWIRTQPGEPRLPQPQRLVVECWARDFRHAEAVIMQRFPMVKAREMAK